MEGSLGNMSQSGLDDYSQRDSITPMSVKHETEKRKNNYKSTKNKRRSKNDSQGRNYKCPQCDKSYLSYPALYTHKKQKHKNTQPAAKKSQKQVSQASSSKRGRPPKMAEKVDPTSERFFESEDKKYSVNSMPYSQSNGMNAKTSHAAIMLELYQECLDDFKRQKINFDNRIFYNQLQPNLNPLYNVLEYVVQQDVENVKEVVKTCDDAFALYLKFVYKQASPELFKHVCKFIIIWREAFNSYGLDKINIKDNASQELRDHVTNLNK